MEDVQAKLSGELIKLDYPKKVEQNELTNDDKDNPERHTTFVGWAPAIFAQIFEGSILHIMVGREHNYPWRHHAKPS